MDKRSQVPLSVIDHAALRSNQAIIIGFLLAAFVSDLAFVVASVAALMLVGAVLRTQAFRWVYIGILRPLRVVQPDPIPDYPAPHRFAQALGGSVLAAATIALVLFSTILGWVLVWSVVLLAAVNLFLGFCVGCFVYYWLSRLRVPGFVHSPPRDTFPGLRPRRP